MLYAPATVSVTSIAASQNGLSDAEVADILFMREEEKLAHDVYVTLGELWGTPVFTNISRAETTHMSAVETLIERYRLDDPVGDNPVGVFTDPTLQAMYDDLVATGSGSLVDALTVGALIEEVDIEDLISSINEPDATDVALVWQQLLAGSQNHLKAFTSQLSGLGIDYQPTVLDSATYDEMLAGAGQGGGTNSNGTGLGTGQQGGRGHGRNS
jgi:hypothetical protein